MVCLLHHQLYMQLLCLSNTIADHSCSSQLAVHHCGPAQLVHCTNVLKQFQGTYISAMLCCVASFRFLSNGNSYLDCGHPCEQHTVQLRDSAGEDHLVLADMGCRCGIWGGGCQPVVLMHPPPLCYIHSGGGCQPVPTAARRPMIPII